MMINRMTSVASQLNRAQGSGCYEDVTIAQVRQHIRDGTIWEFLTERMGADLDLSDLVPLEKLEFATDWADFEKRADHDREFAVERNGLCLLVAFLLESIDWCYVGCLDQRIRGGLPINEETIPLSDRLPDHLNKWKKFYGKPAQGELPDDAGGAEEEGQDAR